MVTGSSNGGTNGVAMTDREAILELADVVGVLATVLSTHSDALLLRAQVDRCNRVIDDLRFRTEVFDVLD